MMNLERLQFVVFHEYMQHNMQIQRFLPLNGNVRIAHINLNGRNNISKRHPLKLLQRSLESFVISFDTPPIPIIQSLLSYMVFGLIPSAALTRSPSDFFGAGSVNLFSSSACC